MLVERIWTGNDYRNYNYLIACPETGEALAIDPLDHEKCLQAAKVRGWQITQLLNTHEHHDHTGGNAAAQALLPQVAGQDPATSVVTTLAQEKAHNTFFRLGNASIIEELRAHFPDLAEQPDPRTVFTRLRELRNKW